MASSHTCVRLALGVGDVTGSEVDDGVELDDDGVLGDSGVLDPLLPVLPSEGVGVELGPICIEDDSGATAKSWGGVVTLRL